MLTPTFLFVFVLRFGLGFNFVEQNADVCPKLVVQTYFIFDGFLVVLALLLLRRLLFVILRLCLYLESQIDFKLVNL